MRFRNITKHLEVVVYWCTTIALKSSCLLGKRWLEMSRLSQFPILRGSLPSPFLPPCLKENYRHLHSIRWYSHETCFGYMLLFDVPGTGTFRNQTSTWLHVNKTLICWFIMGIGISLVYLIRRKEQKQRKCNTALVVFCLECLAGLRERKLFRSAWRSEARDALGSLVYFGLLCF